MTKKKELNNKKLNKVSGGVNVNLSEIAAKKPCPWCGENILKVIWNEHVNTQNPVTNKCNKRLANAKFIKFEDQ